MTLSLNSVLADIDNDPHVSGQSVGAAGKIRPCTDSWKLDGLAGVAIYGPALPNPHSLFAQHTVLWIGVLNLLKGHAFYRNDSIDLVFYINVRKWKDAHLR